MAKSKTDYRPLFFDKLSQFMEDCPNYTLGEVFYSILNQIAKKGVRFTDKKDFLDLTDHQIYAGIDKAIKAEEPEEEENN